MATERFRGGRRTLLFAGAVCIVCSAVVSTAAVTLRPRQERNLEAARERHVLSVSGLLPAGQALDRRQLQALFRQHVRPRWVELPSGRYVTAEEAESRGEPPLAAPPNRALVTQVPRYATVYEVVRAGAVERLILPIEGMGLWSTLRGYLALDADARTVVGITFHQHAETPGLGGEVDSPRWQARWDGRKALDETGVPRLRVIKGRAGPAATDPYRVDGISGATLTGDGVSHMLEFWLGPDAFGPYLLRLGGSS